MVKTNGNIIMHVINPKKVNNIAKLMMNCIIYWHVLSGEGMILKLEDFI